MVSFYTSELGKLQETLAKYKSSKYIVRLPFADLESGVDELIEIGHNSKKLFNFLRTNITGIRKILK